MVLMSIAI
nr:unnamed protein product [Callosobruchus analis]